MSSRASGRRVDVRTFAPGATLAPIVAGFWASRWDLVGQAPHVAEILTEPCVTLAFEAERSRVVGVVTRLFVRALEGRGVIRAVKLRAGAVRALLPDVRAVELADRIVPLGELGLDPDGALVRAVLEPADDADGLAALERWLEARVAARPRAAEVDLAVAIVARAERDPELRRAEDLARVAGFGLRALQRLFREHVGASPKWLVSRFRLREVAARLDQGAVVALADLAAELGYADQAHLCRDFKAATGRPPSALLRAARAGT